MHVNTHICTHVYAHVDAHAYTRVYAHVDTHGGWLRRAGAGHEHHRDAAGAALDHASTRSCQHSIVPALDHAGTRSCQH